MCSHILSRFSRISSPYYAFKYKNFLLLIEKYVFIHFNLDHLKMKGKSYDVNHSQVHPNNGLDKDNHIRKDSIVDGMPKASTSRYVSDHDNCLLICLISVLK
jgi:hypothetical protein